MYNNKCKIIMRNFRNIGLILDLMLFLIKKVFVYIYERVFIVINMVIFCDIIVILRLIVMIICRIRIFMFIIFFIKFNFIGYICVNNYYCKVYL